MRSQKEIRGIIYNLIARETGKPINDEFHDMLRTLLVELANNSEPTIKPIQRIKVGSGAYWHNYPETKGKVQ